jgi:hypothetical protein
MKLTTGPIQGVLRQGQAQGEVRADLDPMLGAFFFIKLLLEILEVVPVMAPLITGRAPEEAVAAAEAAWLDLFWRGIAAPPESESAR